MHRHKENAACARSGEVEEIGTTSIPRSTPADKALAEYILRYPVRSLKDSWELCFIRSLAQVRGPLNSQRSSALQAVWQRLQREVQT